MKKYKKYNKPPSLMSVSNLLGNVCAIPTNRKDEMNCYLLKKALFCAANRRIIDDDKLWMEYCYLGYYHERQIYSLLFRIRKKTFFGDKDVYTDAYTIVTEQHNFADKLDELAGGKYE